MIDEDVPADMPEPDMPEPVGPAPAEDEIWIPETRGPAYLTPGGAVDCAIKHPKLGWIRFAAHADDEVDYGRALHAYWMKREADLIDGLPPDP